MGGSSPWQLLAGLHNQLPLNQLLSPLMQVSFPLTGSQQPRPPLKADDRGAVVPPSTLGTLF